MRFSVVVNTYNRARSLRTTLDALRHQTHSDFEVVVVSCPSGDGTEALLEERAEHLRAVVCPERVLGVSRNLGIDAAAGEVVAFIDDDAIPEPRWLEDLERAYDDDRVGGAGGLTLDPSGTRPQYRYSVCSRIGEPDFTREPPLDRYNRPGADPFVYLQGTNCSFRRDVLVAVDGFDEHFDYIFDESELASRVIDAGHELRPLADAVVHHKFLPSHLRAMVGGAVSVTDPYVPIKNRAYFALRVGRDHQPLAAILASLTRYMDGVKAWARDLARQGHFTRDQFDFWLRRADEGMEAGVVLGLHPEPRTRPIAERRPDAFHPYPTRESGRCVVFVGDAPRARAHAAAGHETHLLEREDGAGYRMDFEDDVWVHRFPVRGRWVHGLHGHPREAELVHAAAVRNAVDRIAERAPVDAVEGSPEDTLLLDADARDVVARLCGLDPQTAADAAAALVDARRFPVDHEHGVRGLLAAGDSDFVIGLYRQILGRDPDPVGLRDYVARLEAGADRIRIAGEVARSEEARGLGVDPGFVRRLPSVRYADAVAGVRAAWLLDDEGFAAALGALLGAPVPDGPRHAALRALVGRRDVCERVEDAPRLLELEPRTRADLVAELQALQGSDDDAFVTGLYLTLLGRPGEPSGIAGYVALMRGGLARTDVLAQIAQSEEARAYGIPPSVAAELPGELRGLDLGRVRRLLQRSAA